MLGISALRTAKLQRCNFFCMAAWRRINTGGGCPVGGAWQSGLLESIINRLLACRQECWPRKMHRGDTEVQVWQGDDYPPRHPPLPACSLLSAAHLAFFYLLTFTSCLQISFHNLPIYHCASPQSIFLPFSASDTTDSPCFWHTYCALSPIVLYSIHLSLPVSLCLSSISPLATPCPIPSLYLALNLSLHPLSFHCLPSIPLCLKLPLFCHPSLFLSVTSVLSHHLTRMKWVLLSSVPRPSLLLPPFPQLSICKSMSLYGQLCHS